MPLTADRPKCLVPLCGKALLEYQLEAYSRCGIRDVVVVTGYRHTAIERYPVRTVFNPRFASTNMLYSLFCAEAELSDDVVIAYGDIIFEATLIDALLRSAAGFSVVVDKGWRRLWELRMHDPLEDAETLKLDSRDNIVEVGKKPRSHDEIQGQYIGLFRICGRALEQVRHFYHALDRDAVYEGHSFENMYMTSFIDRLAKDVLPVKAVLIQHGWLEVDTAEDLRRYEEGIRQRFGLFRLETPGHPSSSVDLRIT